LDAVDAVAAVEVGQRPGDAEHPLLASGDEQHAVDRIGEQGPHGEGEILVATGERKADEPSRSRWGSGKPIPTTQHVTAM
jgi:hypothetical protein